MVRLFSILFITFAGSFLAGCGSSAPKEEPIWKHTKIGDLAPRVPAEPNRQLSDNINIQFYIFDIPVEDANTLDNIWPLLYTQPLQFNDHIAFTMNLFTASFGETPTWSGVGNILRSANARTAEKDSLILVNGRPRNIILSAIGSQQTIFYTSVSHMSEGVTIGPGSFALRIEAKKIPEQRGVCEISVQPVFLPYRPSSEGNLREVSRNQAAPFVFDALGFRLKISPGNFLILGPKRYTAGKAGLSAMFFNVESPRPATRLFMFVCGTIAD